MKNATKEGLATESTGKSVEERVGTALGHRIRVEILALLNEGVRTADELAGSIGESRQTVHHHLKVLLREKSIEIARIERRRNANLYFYRAIDMASFNGEAWMATPSAEREAIAGLIVQHCTAEIIGALGSGKLSNDPMVVLAWNWFNLDEQGRRELSQEQERLWERAQEIEAESANRRAATGEEAATYIVAQWGFERARKAPETPTVSEP